MLVRQVVTKADRSAERLAFWRTVGLRNFLGIVAILGITFGCLLLEIAILAALG